MGNPIILLTRWISEELEKGAPNPQHAVLSTVSKDSIPHARVLAIREINEHGLLFFTQQGTRKVAEMIHNPHVSLTFWFELFQREVIIEGTVRALSPSENKTYWDSYPRIAQIRFHSYAPISSQIIPNKQILEDKRTNLMVEYADEPIPVSEYYCGFRVIPTRFIFYSYRIDELSDVMEYCGASNTWEKRLLSP